MFKTILYSILILCSVQLYSQKKLKIKGSKNVTIEIKAVPVFENLEVSDNLEIYLVKGKETSVEIDADDNLHAMISINTIGNTLQLSTLQTISSSKKCSLRITYTDNLKQVSSRGESKISTLTDLDLDSISFKVLEESKLYINSKAKTISILLDDKSKGEINSKGEKTFIIVSKNATLKALIASNDLNLELSQKSEAKIEGDCTNLKLSTNNSSQFNGKNLTSQNAEITTSDTSNGIVLVKSNLILSMSGKSELELLGEPKIEIKKFSDAVILKKKPSKQ